MFNITIDRFRGYDNTTLEMSKLNILIGENSGGKSSFIKLLLLLKQSMETPNKDKKINVNGHILDLGNFDNLINYKYEEKVFTVTFKIDAEDYLNEYALFMNFDNKPLTEFVEMCSNFISDSINLTFTFSKVDNEFITNNITISSENIGKLTFSINDTDKPKFSVIEDIEGSLVLEHKKHGLITIAEKFSMHGFMLLSNSDGLIKYRNENKTDGLFYEIAFLLITQNYIASQLLNIHYINPIKFQPTRILLRRDSSVNSKITDYESLINTLRSLIESNDETSIQILKEFNSAIKEIGVAEQVTIDTDNTTVSELKVKIAGVWSSVVDVGYGVGLQIPILLQAIICNFNNSNDTLIIEQPEIHLHPALHSKFIEVLMNYAGTTKIIIETHSEHIVRKLQVLVHNKSLESDDV